MSKRRGQDASKAPGLSASIKALIAMRRGLTFQRGLESPEIVVLTNRASAVSKRAEQLARARRTDASAVRELRQMGRFHRHALPDALMHFKARGMDREWRLYNWSARLIEAAIAGTEVAPEDSTLTGRLDAIQGFISMSPDERFSTLSALEPRLQTLPGRPALDWTRQTSPSLEEMRGEVRRNLETYEQLRPLLGPERPEYDPLLSSHTAQDLVAHYLSRLPPDPGTNR